MKTLFYIVALCILTGCMSPRIKPGNITSRLQTGATATQIQSQDPKEKSNLNQESDKEISLTLPPGSALSFSGISNAPAQVIVAGGSAVYKSVTHDKIDSSLGASQKNTMADVAAKLHSLSWLTWLGAAMVLFGLAAFFYAPLKAIIPSNCAIVSAVAGVAFIALPTFIVGHEVLIFAGIGGAAALYWLAHHIGAVTSELQTLRNTMNPAPPAPTSSDSLPRP